MRPNSDQLYYEYEIIYPTWKVVFGENKEMIFVFLLFLTYVDVININIICDQQSELKGGHMMN